MGNPIILRRRVQRDFTILPNDVVRDPRLSWKALGLLIFMLSLPDDFRLQLRFLKNQKPTGRDGTRTGLKELEHAGYLSIRHQRSSGRFAQVIWEVTDTPASAPLEQPSPCSENPNTVNPNPVLPDTEKPTLISTSSEQELSKQKTTTRTPRRSSRVSESAFDIRDLSWPPILDEELFVPAERILRDCPECHRQEILDELAGRIDRGDVRSPSGLLHKLADQARQNRFNPAAGLDYRKKLEAQKKRMEAQAIEEKRESQLSTAQVRAAGKKHLSVIRSTLGTSRAPKQRSNDETTH